MGIPFYFYQQKNCTVARRQCLDSLLQIIRLDKIPPINGIVCGDTFLRRKVLLFFDFTQGCSQHDGLDPGPQGRFLSKIAQMPEYFDVNSFVSSDDERESSCTYAGVLKTYHVITYNILLLLIA